MSSSHNHHDHGHAHAPAVSRHNERKVLVAFFITFSFMIVEAVGGLLSGSLALLADAGHMLTDAAALALAYAAFRLGRRAADHKRTFGYQRFEVIAGLVNAITLFLIVAWIGYEAWQRFQQPHEVLAGPMLAVAAIGLAVNLFVLRLLTRGGDDHVNIRGAVLHVIGDLLGSVATIAAAIVIYFTGWVLVDPILSLAVSMLILLSAYRLMSKSLHILLEGVPENATPAAIERHLIKQVPGLAGVNHIHVWLITSGRALATLHIQPQPHADVRTMTHTVERELLTHFDIEHATVAIDWDGSHMPCSFSHKAIVEDDSTVK